MFNQLDRLDRKLLTVLDTDSRQSYSKMAKALKLGNDLIEYRISKYLELRLIDRFSVVADPFAVGWWVIKNYVKLKSNQKKLSSLLELVKKNRNTYWVAEFHGRFDLLFSYIAITPNDCRNFEEDFKNKSRDSILNYQVVLPTKVTRFSKKYINSTKGTEYVFTSNKPQVSVDEIDISIISLLYENARYTLKDLAEKISLTPTTVNNRIQKLEEEKVILGYRFQLNYQVFGVLFFKLLLQLTDHSRDYRDKLFDFCRQHPNVTCFIEQVGAYPIEIEVEIPDYQNLNEFVDLFREKFDAGLSSCETLMIKNDHMHRFPDRS